MKKNRVSIVLVIVALLFGINRMVAEPITIIGKAKINIPTLNLNNGKYADLENLGKALFPGALFVSESGTLINKFYKIKCSNGSFFVLLKTTEEQSVAQMTLPAVEIEGRIKVPFVEFLGALAQLDLIEYDNTANGSFIQFKSAKSESKPDIENGEVFVKQAGTESGESAQDAKYVRICPKDKHVREIQPKPVYPETSHASDIRKNESEAKEATSNVEPTDSPKLHEEEVIHQSSEQPTATMPIPEQPAGKYSIPPELNRSVIEEYLPKK